MMGIIINNHNMEQRCWQLSEDYHNLKMANNLSLIDLNNDLYPCREELGFCITLAIINGVARIMSLLCCISLILFN